MLTYFELIGISIFSNYCLLTHNSTDESPFFSIVWERCTLSYRNYSILIVISIQNRHRWLLFGSDSWDHWSVENCSDQYCMGPKGTKKFSMIRMQAIESGRSGHGFHTERYHWKTEEASSPLPWVTSSCWCYGQQCFCLTNGQTWQTTHIAWWIWWESPSVSIPFQTFHCWGHKVGVSIEGTWLRTNLQNLSLARNPLTNTT